VAQAKALPLRVIQQLLAVEQILSLLSTAEQQRLSGSVATGVSKSSKELQDMQHQTQT
jgi:hypothetical protein